MEYEHETPRVLAERAALSRAFSSSACGLLSTKLKKSMTSWSDTPPSLGFLTLGVIYAATGLLVTVHPAMLDVMSMSQFLLIMSETNSDIHDAGAVLKQDFLHYLITRHDPNDQPQAQVVALLRHLFAEDVLMPTAVESTAIESAGLAKRTLYELEPGNIGRDTFRRARESMDAVNERILELIEESFGRR